ncbi:hypothetical protein SL1157_2494 [Ruegeria lacuscaerulensis ITI-1157]|nr:hypothetical protein SL1157_2494 [Ruegeria lacuscaerulensis ITI-1157]
MRQRPKLEQEKGGHTALPPRSHSETCPAPQQARRRANRHPISDRARSRSSA